MATLPSPMVGRRVLTRRRLGTLLAATLLVAIIPGTAAAAAPGNDTPAGAIAITAVPTTIEADTSQATVAGDDVGCGKGGVDQASVWYTLTVATDTAVQIDASQSDYGVGVNIFAGVASADTLIECQGNGLTLGASAGTTYLLMFSDLDGGANGGHLVVTLDVAPRPLTVAMTVDPWVKSNQKTGEATLTGTLTCSIETQAHFIQVGLRQAIGRSTVVGSGGADAACGPTPARWVVVVTADAGTFVGGKASADVFAQACHVAECNVAQTTASVKIRR